MQNFHEYVSQMSHGAGHMRFIVQPVMALLLGARDGRLDSHQGRPSIFRTLHKKGLGPALWRIAVPLVIAMAASLLFQYLIMHRVRLHMALLYALLFVALPYLLMRGFSREVDARVHYRGT